MKKAFIICGPETSGTRLTRMCFLKAGVQEVGFDMGPALDVFERDTHLLLMKQSKEVFARRSIPHGWKRGEPIDMLDIAKYHIGFLKQGFDPYWIVPIRNFHALARAKEKKRRKDDKRESIDVVTGQYNYIFARLIDVGAAYYFFNVSALMLNVERELIGLERWTGVRFPLADIEREVYDADKKYYERNRT